jgi:hypothetical protein
LTIALDMAPFVIVLAVVVASFAVAFRALFAGDRAREDRACEFAGAGGDLDCDAARSGYATLGDALVTTMFAGVFGDFDRDVVENYALHPTATLALMVLMLLSISLIVLNALIAFMGDSYNKVSEQRYSELSRERASLIVELCTGLDAARLAEIQRATKWAYILMPASDLEEVNGAEHEWEGELAEIKRAVRNALMVELAPMASKTDLDAMASKADFDAMASKADLAAMASKADLAAMASKADLAAMASRSKADLDAAIEMLLARLSK